MARSTVVTTLVTAMVCDFATLACQSLKLQKQCLAGGKGVLWCLLVLYGLMLDDAQLRQTTFASLSREPVA